MAARLGLDSRAVEIWRVDLEHGDVTGPASAAAVRHSCTGALRVVLARHLGCRPARVRLARRPSGKPYLVGPRPTDAPLHFNLSRAGSRCLIAVSRQSPVGVDLERVRPVGDLDRMAGTFFAPSEAEAIRAERGARKLHAFFRCWTRKEAYAKAVGHGLRMPFDRFAVSVEDATCAPILSLVDDDPASWTLRSFTPWPGFVGACAVRQALPGPDLTFRGRTA